MIPLPIVMFLLLTIFILLNIPVAFSLLFTAIIIGLWAWGPASLDIIINNFWAVMNNWPLVAIPLFVFMSSLMEKCLLADEMFDALYTWLGHIRGSLLVISIVLGAIIGAMSGVAAAGVVTLAMLVYPLMRKYNYPENLSIGATIYAGVLPQLIPPSLNIIVYGTCTGVSIGKLFAGGMGMGILMVLLGTTYVLLWSHIHKDRVPVISPEKRVTLREKVLKVRGFIPPAIIISGTLGSIYAGIATPTEAAGVGALVTFLYAVVKKRLNRKVLLAVLVDTLKLTSMICFIVSGSYAFGAVFSGIGGRRLVVEALLSLPNARITALALSLAIIFVLGMFIETVSIAAIAGPLLSPAMQALGYDPTWWGVIFCTMLMTAFLSPPVGMGMFIFKGVRPEVSMSEIYKSVWPFIALQVLTLLLGVAFPEIPLLFIRLLAPT